MSEPTKCPICNKDVDPLRARAMGIFGGRQYYFCSQDCKAKFADPRKAPRDETPPPTKPEVSAAAPPEPPKAKDSPVKKAKAAAAAAAEEEAAEDKPVKKDPTPSVMEDLGAVQSGAGRVWGLVIVLFAAAGVVLFFALK
jgi:YHS domain-containing protein